MKKPLVLSFLLFLFLSTIVSANIIYVDDDNTGFADGTIEHPYSHIYMGVEQAKSGDTVYVFNGTYGEHILIDKPITLMGENRETTKIYSIGSSILEITSDNVNVEGFDFINPCRLIYPEIYVSSDHCSISNNLFTNHLPLLIVCTITLNGANNNVISSNIFSGEAQTITIALNNSHHNVIEGNWIDMSAIGIGLLSSNWNLITKNALFAKCLFYASSNNTITFNTFPGLPILSFAKVTDTVVGKNNFGLYKVRHYLQLKEPIVYLQESDVTFDKNYWGRARFFPKIIFGEKQIAIDWHPASQPNN